MATKREQLLVALREFIRSEGSEYLNDPNISSIGVGYKIVDGAPTEQLAVQFTVDEKVEPEALESLNTEAIPDSIEVDGVRVPTDVIQRSYEPSFRVVAEPEPPPTKVRCDPIRPGISVSNVKGTAGTVGCIVYDKHDGTPLVLSNWHVLHGPDGRIGDTVVQPGPRDDNRIDRNRLGVLNRSHLGIAGDCAVATVEDRRIDDSVLGIGVTPARLGEPELGDKVVKSGRTTGVTHGVVRRIDTIVKLRYGSAGVHNIGCFEIGPDPARPAAHDEISRGGDSGSVWLFEEGGTTTGVLAGLHFAGESEHSPDEHALACLPQSVFEKLEITLRPPTPVEAAEAVRKGYDPNFLATSIDAPSVDTALRNDLVQLDGSEVVAYTHFSLALSKSRRFARWVAWNIDGSSLKKIDRVGIEFVKDARLPAEFQTGNELYRDNRLDRGHIARRADLLWAALPEAQQANTDSFFYTNITPQMDDFNQSGKDGLWGQLEDAVFADVQVQDLRVSAFGGPVFHDDDRVYRGSRIPREYFKILAFVDGGDLKARAFLLTQGLDQLEALDLDEFRVFQVAIAEVEERTGVRFGPELRKADTFTVLEGVEQRRPLDSLADIQW
ncbi:endonuclease G [Nocardia amikacinitolerans]|uniref:DNA/RNA non-specific endonuclease n=1 Tax=Nocardia amikacinitolerans TaxID=756689 RepID=UPI0020A5640A|nr:DNA/RNA non-specific endonuclease [Nocardia amikacinitolerans]MCP2294686.1 endonuclease G [Nocardia amikacinitolerans]